MLCSPAGASSLATGDRLNIFEKTIKGAAMPAIRIGINPISWSNDDLPSLGGETPLSTALSEGKDIGYEGFELNGKFPKDAKGVGDVLRPYDLALVSGW